MTPLKHKNMNNPNTYDLVCLSFSLSVSLLPPPTFFCVFPWLCLVLFCCRWISHSWGREKDGSGYRDFRFTSSLLVRLPKWENVSLRPWEYKTLGNQVWKLYMSHSTPRVGRGGGWGYPATSQGQTERQMASSPKENRELLPDKRERRPRMKTTADVYCISPNGSQSLGINNIHSDAVSPWRRVRIRFWTSGEEKHRNHTERVRIQALVVRP